MEFVEVLWICLLAVLPTDCYALDLTVHTKDEVIGYKGETVNVPCAFTLANVDFTVKHELRWSNEKVGKVYVYIPDRGLDEGQSIGFATYKRENDNLIIPDFQERDAGELCCEIKIDNNNNPLSEKQCTTLLFKEKPTSSPLVVKTNSPDPEEVNNLDTTSSNDSFNHTILVIVVVVLALLAFGGAGVVLYNKYRPTKEKDDVESGNFPIQRHDTPQKDIEDKIEENDGLLDKSNDKSEKRKSLNNNNSPKNRHSFITQDVRELAKHIFKTFLNDGYGEHEIRMDDAYSYFHGLSPKVFRAFRLKEAAEISRKHGFQKLDQDAEDNESNYNSQQSAEDLAQEIVSHFFIEYVDEAKKEQLDKYLHHVGAYFLDVVAHHAADQDISEFYEKEKDMSENKEGQAASGGEVDLGVRLRDAAHSDIGAVVNRSGFHIKKNFPRLRMLSHPESQQGSRTNLNNQHQDNVLPSPQILIHSDQAVFSTSSPSGGSEPSNEDSSHDDEGVTEAFPPH